MFSSLSMTNWYVLHVKNMHQWSPANYADVIGFGTQHKSFEHVKAGEQHKERFKNLSFLLNSVPQMLNLKEVRKLHNTTKWTDQTESENVAVWGTRKSTEVKK